MKLGYQGKYIPAKYINIVKPKEGMTYSNLANETIVFRNGEYQLITHNLKDFLQYPQSNWVQLDHIYSEKEGSFIEKIKFFIRNICFSN